MTRDEQNTTATPTGAGAATAPQPGLTDQVMESYQALEQQANQIKEQATQINNQVSTFIKNNPAMAIAGAFGIGYLVGSMAARRWII